MVFSLLLIFSVLIHFLEKDLQPEAFGNILDSMWYGIATLTTVGYGDVVPITLGGRIFTIIVLILGLLIVTVPAGLSATSLIKAREIQEEEERKKSKNKLE